MRRFLLFGSLWILLAASGVARSEPDRFARAVARAQDALAAGQPEPAIRALTQALADSSGEEAAELRCLLGRAHLAADAPAAAESVLAAVPADAPCGRRAAFHRADALLRLDRADEAVALYATQGAPQLGDDRDAQSAEALLGMARGLLDADSAEVDRAILVLTGVLGLQIADERHTAVARELVDTMDVRVDEPWNHASAGPACAAMQAALRRADDRGDRLRAALVCEREAGWGLLAPLAGDPDARELMARRSAGPVAQRLREGALVARGAEAPEALHEAVVMGRRADLAAVPDLVVLGTPESLLAAARRLAGAGRWAEAIEALRALVTAHPTDPGLDEAVALQASYGLALARTRLGADDAAGALAAYDEVLRTAPHAASARVAALEAGVAARAAGDRATAEARWDLVLARWPATEEGRAALAHRARLLLIDDDDAPGAIAFLEARPEPYAAALLQSWRATDVALETAGPDGVSITARNLDEVELRLHRIDPEAFLRAGGAPDDLRALDIAVVAPDRTWTVPVPDPAPYVDHRFAIPVDVPAPGLYAVTVASPTEEARVLLFAGALDVVARTSGRDLAVAVFDAAGRPVGAAEVLVRTADGIERIRTDATGLARTTVTAGSVVVMARHRGAVGFLDVPTLDVRTTGALEVSAELERPLALPGDALGLRARALRAGVPVRGAWTLWLQPSGGSPLTPFEATSDRRGLLVVDVPVPPTEGRYRPDGEEDRFYQIMGLPPGAADPVKIATFRVEPDRSAGRSVAVAIEDGEAVVQVREASGAPAGDVTVGLGDRGSALTDATGRLRVAGPPEGIDDDVVATLAGSPASGGASWTSEGSDPVTLRLAQDRLRPGERPRLLLDGEGLIDAALLRVTERIEPPPPPADPWAAPPVDPAPIGGESWLDDRPRPVLEEELVTTVAVAADPVGEGVGLPALTEGRYVVRVVGDASYAEVHLDVASDGLRLRGAEPTSLGRGFEYAVDDGPALVVVSAPGAGGREGGILHAAVLSDSRSLTGQVDARWGRRVRVAALGPRRVVHERVVAVDDQLGVTVQTEPLPDGRALVVATVLDPRGVPARAQVALAGFAASLGRPWDQIVPSYQGPALPPNVTSARSVPFVDADDGEPIAGALLVEARRETERRKAETARTGVLDTRAFREAPLDSLGLSGSGYGAGGGALGGRGTGAMGGVGYAPRSSRTGRVPTRPVGVRTRGLWHVAETDASGVVRAVLDGPPAAWTIRVTAVGDLGGGRTETVVDTRERVFVVAHEPGPGRAGDLAQPEVTVVNGTDAPFVGSLAMGEASVDVALAPGEAVRTAIGQPRGPGPEVRDVVLGAGSTEVAHARWRFPLARGVPDPDGAIVTVHVGPDGAFPFAELLAAEDPTLPAEPWRWAARGRVALAGLAQQGDPRLSRVVRDARDRSAVGPEPADAALEVMFLAELRDSGRLDVAPAEIERAAARLQASGTVEASAWTVLARARAGLPVDPDLLSFLREAELSEREAGLFARGLAWLGEAAEARQRAPQGLHGDLVRLALGDPVDHDAWRRAAPPPPTDPDWSDWVRLAATPARVDRAVATVQVAGQPRASIDLSLGGTVRLIGEGDVAVDAPGAVVVRESRPVAGTARVGGHVLPEVGHGRVAREVIAEVPALSGEAGCSPCVLRVGDRLWLPAYLEVAPTLLREEVEENGARLFRAEVPGRTVLTGLRRGDEPLADIVVEVVRDGATTPPAPAVALAQADSLAPFGLRPPLPAPDAVPDRVGALAARQLRRGREDGDADAMSRAFLRLVAVQPSTALDLPEVASVAEAMAGTGRTGDAARVWRAGLDAAFRAEASRLDGVRPATGELAYVRLVRDAALRYPDGSAVGHALYLLPNQLWGLAGDEPDEAWVSEGVTALDLRLTAAAWDRELLARHPDHERAAAAGLRLSRSLLTLGLPEDAARWARITSAAHPDDPLADSLLYLQALALAEAGDRAAEPLLQRLTDQAFPAPGGGLQPSEHRWDAYLVRGRLREARGDVDGAVAAYEQVIGRRPEAARSVAALQRSVLEAPPSVVLEPRDDATVPLTVQGVDEVDVRAYAIDLRTVFLRDGGLSGVGDIAVAGVSPTWSGKRSLGAGAWPVEREVRLPLSGSGAWLVHLEAGEVRATTLVVRSALSLSTYDDGSVRRVVVRRGSAPAARVEVRALSGGDIAARQTDVRGVVEVGRGAAVLAFDGVDVAFTLPRPAGSSSAPAPAPSLPLELLDQRLGTERARDQERYRKRFQEDQAESMSLEAL